MPENEGAQPTPNHSRAAGAGVLLRGVLGTGNHSSLLSLHLGDFVLDRACLAFVEDLSGSSLSLF